MPGSEPTTSREPMIVASQGPIEPLFTHNIRLWLRVWGVTQAAALLVAARVVPVDTTVIVTVVLLAAYHAVGLVAYERIISRLWIVLLYVPIGWVLILAAARMNGAFGLLVFGAIVQGFLFLPFRSAVVALVLVLVVMSVASVAQARNRPPSMLLMQLTAIVATGTMIGTVLLYIHRMNREAAIRADLLRRLNEAQRDLADRAHEAGVTEERQRLSRDIHDTLAQAFASIIRHLEAAQLALRPAEDTEHENGTGRALEAVMPHLTHAQSVSRDSLADIRRLVLALRPVELAEAPLSDAIGRIVKQWGDANAVAAVSSVDPLPALHPDADVIFLRAVQESLSNVARHANARHVRVTLTRVDELALLTVEDDGVGFEQADTTGHEKLGLSGMRERVRRFGGHVLIESVVGTGTNLTVAMPLAAIASGGGARAETVGRTS